MGTAVVVGAGPAGLIAAERLARAGLQVTVIEQMPSPARKFLFAGRGGLNLTHAEPMDVMLGRYGAAAATIRPALAGFPPDALRRWCDGLGETSFVGSSGRVFPASFKTTPLLRAWLARLAGLGVVIHTRTRWLGWQDGRLSFAAGPASFSLDPDVTVLALGGAAWPRLGSDGGWAAILRGIGVEVQPFRPANCGVTIAWSTLFRERFAGAPLKRVVLTVDGQAVPGEAVVTQAGLEGGVLYAHSAAIRDALARGEMAVPMLDLRPDLEVSTLAGRLASAGGSASLANRLRKAGLSPVAAGLLREAGALPTAPWALASRIKAVPLEVTGVQGLDRAISSAGGIALEAIDPAFMLRSHPGVFVAGEMLDWEAPTGGYLLQASFSTGVWAADGALAWVAAR